MFASLTNTFNKFFPYLAAGMARRREARYAERETRRRQARFVRLTLEGLEGRIALNAYTYVGQPGRQLDNRRQLGGSGWYFWRARLDGYGDHLWGQLLRPG